MNLENGRMTTIGESMIHKLRELSDDVINGSHPNELFYGRSGISEYFLFLF